MTAPHRITPGIPAGGTMARTLALLLTFACALPLAAGEPTGARPGRDQLLAAARDAMSAIRYCALISLDAAGRPNARVVDAFAPDEEMTVWFATNPKSRKVAEIRRDPRVTLFYFDPQAPEQGYVTIAGRARLVDDPAEKERRWKEGFEAFWPDRGEGYLLVEVTPERLEISSASHGIANDAVTWAAPSIAFDR
jgi:general stress protein 26